MGTMNISLPDTLRDFADEQVARRGYGTSTEYVRDPIRCDQERLHLRVLLIEGAESPTSGNAGSVSFRTLRKYVHSATAANPSPRGTCHAIAVRCY